MFIKTKKFIRYSRDLKSKVKKLRKNMTSAENKLWYECLRGYRYRFVRQKAIDNYILDFYCQKLKLGIEVDGETHLSNRSQVYDKVRTETLSKLGIEILRFWNDEVLCGLESVESVIENKVKEKEENPLNPPLQWGE